MGWINCGQTKLLLSDVCWEAVLHANPGPPLSNTARRTSPVNRMTILDPRLAGPCLGGHKQLERPHGTRLS